MNDKVGVWMDKWMDGREGRKGEEEKGDWCLRRWSHCWMKTVVVLTTPRYDTLVSSDHLTLCWTVYKTLHLTLPTIQGDNLQPSLETQIQTDPDLARFLASVGKAGGHQDVVSPRAHAQA